MRKTMLKRIFRILRNILIVLILLGVALFFAIQHPTVQTWLAQRAADYLSGQLGAKVEIGRVEIDLWANLIIRDLYIEDQHQDTLAFIPELRLKEYTWDRKQGKFEVQEAVMESPFIQIQRYAEDTTLNIAFITNYINSFPPSEDTTGTEILLSNIQLRNARLAYNNEHNPIRTSYGIDWNHLYLDSLNLNLAQLHSKGDSLVGRIAHISAHE
ncbi:MAG: hypothetical protein ACOYLH_09440, partial [Flavobacteriales bacterium]